jgi:hypothetical protein
VELYLHSPIRLHGVVLDKHRDCPENPITVQLVVNILTKNVTNLNTEETVEQLRPEVVNKYLHSSTV